MKQKTANLRRYQTRAMMVSRQSQLQRRLIRFARVTVKKKLWKEPDRPIKEEEVKFEHQEDRCETRDGAAPAKRGRPTENPCWGYFIRLDDQNVRCRLCNKPIAFRDRKELFLHTNAFSSTSSMI
ncbi:hypothetical protein OESDEN_08446 [Oesophagostomum dentatum]|uniref:BED-type domain-containing protein n=1 Tax=Oesophagostomum dentatum TaxID=61180 RepID=A0A0B1T8K9_OESDE|nr:hypothetical protein OESDEN_08446 [Oesophagostomum dentatum]